MEKTYSNYMFLINMSWHSTIYLQSQAGCGKHMLLFLSNTLISASLEWEKTVKGQCRFTAKMEKRGQKKFFLKKFLIINIKKNLLREEKREEKL